jgi:hypothetical protein
VFAVIYYQGRDRMPCGWNRIRPLPIFALICSRIISEATVSQRTSNSYEATNNCLIGNDWQPTDDTFGSEYSVLGALAA